MKFGKTSPHQVSLVSIDQMETLQSANFKQSVGEKRKARQPMQYPHDVKDLAEKYGHASIIPPHHRGFCRG